MEYRKIEGEGRQGDFVHQHQDMATKQGFGNVSKLWYDKTISYDDGMEMLETERGHRQDHLVTRGQMMFDVREIDSRYRFGVEIDDQFYIPTDHALNQLVSKSCNGKGTGFVRSLVDNLYDAKDSVKVERDMQDASTVLSIVRNGIRRVDAATKFKVRCHDDGSMRAFLSEKYAEVDNRWYLDQIKDVVPGGRLSHWRGNSDTIFGNVLIPDTIREEDDSDYGGMVSISNCEIGKRNVKSLPSIFRAICMNGCIWDQTRGYEIKVRHIGEIDLAELSSKLRQNIEAQIPLIPQGIERLLGVRAMGTDGIPVRNLIAATAETHSVDKRGASAILTAWVADESKIAPAERSLFDIVNSVTRAGQSLDNQSWVKFDELGGRLVNYTEKEWSNLKIRAESYEDKDFKRIYSGKLTLSA
ncbi:MAG: hypothetical protein CMI54_04115 [Parcubacteria group bacterium]|nr:hypothetical protein [Parcubacteria group bacterium]|tara:strand:+ start:901 stop:2142 length:1242 start_codon:yes stop_codon:yes gene_type:complete